MTPEQREKWMEARYKHGGFLGGKENPEHYIWRTMLARCKNPNAKNYASYGGRGVTVCTRWASYSVFLNDMGQRPSPDHSLDRINVDGDYEPSNCRWATRSEQQKNKRSTRLYTNGIFTGTLVECAAQVGIGKELAHWRWKTHGTFKRGTSWHELQRGL